ncbi:hypothetical protein AR505_0567 [methanogenic archaeon ISO4-H5]|nr:hypothetical protein AR505_0567 [methanogenic archaeon ISO4-H5]
MSFHIVPFGDCDLSDTFFDSLRADYPGFNQWFQTKSNAGYKAYIDCDENGKLHVFVALKQDPEFEELGVDPVLPPVPRLKISTIKIDESFSGQRLGEGAMGIALWTWARSKERQIYVTTFKKQKSLIQLLEKFGFKNVTRLVNGELVYLRDKEDVDYSDPRKSFPYINPRFPKAKYLPIKDIFHDSMFQYSDLKGVIKQEYSLPVSNGITKIYIAAPITKLSYSEGDLVFIYRMYTGDGPKKYKSAVTSYCTVGKVIPIVHNKEIIVPFEKYRDMVGNKSVYPDELIEDIFNREKNVFLIELIYNGYFGTGNNINLDTLRKNGLWNDNIHPYDSLLSREQVQKIFTLGNCDVQNININ